MTRLIFLDGKVQNHVGRPKDLKKRQLIIDAAKKMFLEHGYHASSLNQIARLAGVSKLTVYNHFEDKAQLFTHAIENSCELYLNTSDRLQLQPSSDFKMVMTQVCHMALDMVCLPEAIKLERLLLELAAENNPLLLPFFNASHQKMRAFWEHLFQQAIALDFMPDTDIQMATDTITSLLMGSRHHEILLNQRAVPTATERTEIIERSIHIFGLVYLHAT